MIKLVFQNILRITVFVLFDCFFYTKKVSLPMVNIVSIVLYNTTNVCLPMVNINVSQLPMFSFKYCYKFFFTKFTLNTFVVVFLLFK